jgi:hypothetical protein
VGQGWHWHLCTHDEFLEIERRQVADRGLVGTAVPVRGVGFVGVSQDGGGPQKLYSMISVHKLDDLIVPRFFWLLLALAAS